MTTTDHQVFFWSFFFICLLPSFSYATPPLEKCVASRVIGSFVDVDFSPHKIASRTQSHVQMETNATLYRRGRDGGVINELAKNTIIDLHKRTMQVEIDTSCHWSDGKPITVYDIQEGIHRLFTADDPTILSLYLKNGIDINNGDKDLSELGLRILNDTTIEFDLVATPHVLQHMLAFNAVTPAPLHLENKWPGDGTSMIRISSGPFVAVKHTDKRIDFERNPYYCDGFESNTEKIIHHGIDSRRTVGRMMDAGLVNIGEQIAAPDLKAFKESDNFHKKFSIWSVPPQVMAYLGINPNSAIGADPALKKAVLLSIDFEKLESVIGADGLHGRHMPSLNFEYNGYNRIEVEDRLDKPYSKRLAQAQKIMRDKGYGSNTPLKLDFGLRRSAPYEQLGFAIAGMLNQIYVEAKTEIVKQQSNRVLYDLSINAWGTGMSDPIATLSGLAAALSQIGNKDFEKKLHNAILTDITKTRNETLRQLEQEIVDMKIFHPLYEVLSPTVIAKNIKPGAEFYDTGRNMIFDDCD